MIDSPPRKVLLYKRRGAPSLLPGCAKHHFLTGDTFVAQGKGADKTLGPRCSRAGFGPRDKNTTEVIGCNLMVG
jgi:hypothetical protein